MTHNMVMAKSAFRDRTGYRKFIMKENTHLMAFIFRIFVKTISTGRPFINDIPPGRSGYPIKKINPFSFMY